MVKSLNLNFFSDEKIKFFALYKIRKYFKQELMTKRKYFFYADDGNISFSFNKYSTLYIMNIDKCDCILDLIDIINKVNKKHKLLCYSSGSVTKDIFTILDEKLESSLSIKGYRKYK